MAYFENMIILGRTTVAGSIWATLRRIWATFNSNAAHKAAHIFLPKHTTVVFNGECERPGV